MSTYKVRNNEGQEFEVEEARIGEAERDGFLPVVSNGKQQHRVSVADLSKALQDGYRPLVATAGAESSMRGAAQGITAGFADEAYGLVGAIVNPTNSDKGFWDRYSDSRDYARGRDTDAERANPGTFMASNIGGGAASAVLTGGATAGLKGAAGMGAAAGLGMSEADLTEGEVGQAALDTAFGAGVGAAGYGAVKGAMAGARGAVAAGKKLNPYLAALGRGAKAGGREASESAIQVPLVHAGQTTVGAVKGAIEEIKQTSAGMGEFKKVAKEAMKVLRAGENGSIGSVSDDEAVLAALLSDGDNPVKQWFATKSAVLSPGQGSADDYLRLLNTPGEERQAARAFDSRQAAAELRPEIEEVQGLFESARNQRFGQLQNAARETFDTSQADTVLDSLEGTIADVAEINSVPGATKAVLADVHGMLSQGKGTKQLGLQSGEWGAVDPAERFNRLQKARELIDQQVNWSKREGLGQAEAVLRSVRGEIDAALKISPDKVEADALYSTSKNLEGNFFGATEFRNQAGGIEVDEGKIKRLLGDSDTAHRFRNTINQMREYASREDLSPEFRQKMADTLRKIEEKIGTADNKRALGSFRQVAGPSSPAIERMQSLSGKNSLLKDAVNAPAGFLNSADEFAKFVQQRTGTRFQELPPETKIGATKFWTWWKNYPDASPQAIEKMWGKWVK